MKLVMKSLMPPWNNQDAEKLEDDDDEVGDEELDTLMPPRNDQDAEELEDDDDEVDDEEFDAALERYAALERPGRRRA